MMIDSGPLADFHICLPSHPENDKKIPNPGCADKLVITARVKEGRRKPISN